MVLNAFALPAYNKMEQHFKERTQMDADCLCAIIHWTQQRIIMKWINSVLKNKMKEEAFDLKSNEQGILSVRVWFLSVAWENKENRKRNFIVVESTVCLVPCAFLLLWYANGSCAAHWMYISCILFYFNSLSILSSFRFSLQNLCNAAFWLLSNHRFQLRINLKQKHNT